VDFIFFEYPFKEPRNTCDIKNVKPGNPKMTRKNLRPELLVQVLILLLLIPAIIVVGRPRNEANTASSSLAIYSDIQQRKNNAGEDNVPKFPAGGPGGPILIISSATNPFSIYLSEILRAEGLNEFAVRDISAISTPMLEKYDVVLLGEINVSVEQVRMLTGWVNKGGTFIAFKPSQLFNSLFGISRAGGTLSDKYLLVNTRQGPGVGIVPGTIQFHGKAELYGLNGASELAMFYSSASIATRCPAITSRNIGSNGGKAIAFAYDLARSVVYTRQGNLAWAGQKRDGQINPIRSDDLFYPDWIDFNKVAIPQADEQQRLLANIILEGNLHRKPLPRFWYLPRDLKAVIVMTGDNHTNNGTTGRFYQYLTLGPNTAQDVSDWKTVRATSYIYPDRPINNEQAVFFEEQGFEISLHTNTGCFDYTYPLLQKDFGEQLGRFAASYPGVSKPVTNRSHCLNWSDWSSTPKIESQNGIRLDATYYYWPEAWMKNRPGMFTGSGIPMRFADTDGSIIDVYQMPTQITDETNMDYSAFCNAILDKATGPEGYYGVFCANMHTDIKSSAGSDAIIASAQARDVPIISARQMLTWLDARNASSFGDIKWENNQLSFSINMQNGANNLKAMLPLYTGSGQLNAVTCNGANLPFTKQLIKGIQYVFFAPVAGVNTYVAAYVNSGETAGNNASPIKSPVEPPGIEEIYVNIMPNPSMKYFNMVINNRSAEAVMVRISDASGKLVEIHEKVAATGILQLGHAWKPGTYFAEVIQRNSRKTVKMIKVN
jgi:hypothetical protein